MHQLSGFRPHRQQKLIAPREDAGALLAHGPVLLIHPCLIFAEHGFDLVVE
jgi:hypothetical protein